MTLPVDIDPILGIFVPDGTHCLQTVSRMPMQEVFGDDVPFLGAGIAGAQMWSCRWRNVGLMTALNGGRNLVSNVVVADPSEFRRKRAQNLGFLAVSEDKRGSTKARWP